VERANEARDHYRRQRNRLRDEGQGPTGGAA
jgi:hypothetical protein